jgi:hypothetical protein
MRFYFLIQLFLLGKVRDDSIYFYKQELFDRYRNSNKIFSVLENQNQFPLNAYRFKLQRVSALLECMSNPELKIKYPHAGKFIFLYQRASFKVLLTFMKRPTFDIA